MKIFDKEKFDLFSTSPGNYIFKKKSNKSEFGKLLSIFHIFVSITILIYFLYHYFKGSEKNIFYSKKTFENSDIYKNKNDEYIFLNDKLKNYAIYIYIVMEKIILQEQILRIVLIFI